MKFFARFSNIHLEITLSMIYSFLKQIRKKYNYKWVRKNEKRVLMIFGEKTYELPFKEEENKIFLSLDELTTNEKGFALTFNQLLFEARKKKLGIASAKQKVIKPKKIELQNAVIKQKKKRSEELETMFDSQQRMLNYVIQTEIDYLLMDLHEALQIHDQEKVSWCKQQLEEMVKKKQTGFY
jgi:hypothetical protein